jgi:hypothetical protein
MSSRIELQAGVAGRFALEALRSGEGEVCATFRRSFYLKVNEKYACIGDPVLGRGPLNALVRDFAMPAIGERIRVGVDHAVPWEPRIGRPSLDPKALRAAPIPAEGLGCLILGKHNGLAMHAQPALDAIDRWIEGHSLAQEAELLLGLGPGLTPSGDDYFGGVLVALHALGRASQAQSLWRWLEPRLASRTSAISAAHVAAAASGQAHEALHEILNGNLDFKRLDEVGHTSGWDALAGATAVITKG